MEQIVAAILKEKDDSDSCLGYRSMWKKLRLSHGLKVKRDEVMLAMRVIDPKSVDRRKKHRLVRRVYANPCLNCMCTWHIDGNDKLKPYGFAVHGCIDGFSRRIVWLEVGPSNKNPYIIASYYLNCLKRVKITPKIILKKSDHGRENQVVNFLQSYFRLNDEDGNQRSFIFVNSCHNQRIEFYWSILRKQFIDWWMVTFNYLGDSGKYIESDPLHQECLRYCFTRFLRKGFNNVASEWNKHRPQVHKQNEYSRGIPDILYFLPESVNSRSYGTIVDDNEIEACHELYVRELPHSYGCCDDFLEIVIILVPDCNVPSSTEQALSLFFELIQLIDETIK